MRADRLLSLLMLLQLRGQMTAPKLARELEVSERTVYRDIDALSAAGIPIYSDRGPKGGYALLDSYRTNLTGLTEAEVRALFMLSIPAPLQQLGVSKELKAALLKLFSSLPDARRGDEQQVRQRFHLDSTWWFQGGESLPLLPILQEAVWQDQRLTITYRQYLGPSVDIEREVDPYGLVAKAGIWYLVYALSGRIRAQRVSHLLNARMVDETFLRPKDFDLAAFWQRWCYEFEHDRPHFRVTMRVAQHLAPDLQRAWGGSVQIETTSPEPPDAGGWVSMAASFESFEAARARILGCGGAVEVLKPEPLRLSVLDYARQIDDLYGEE